MLYELRAYDLIAGKAPAYLELFRTAGVQYVTRHLPMAGYWLTDSGTLNRIYHLWIYESLEERAACRARLAGDRDWNDGFVPNGFPLIVTQRNFIMAVRETSPSLDAVTDARNTVHDGQTKAEPMFSPSLLSLTFTFGKSVSSSGKTERIGMWEVKSGSEVGMTVSLFRHPDGNALSTANGAGRHEILRPLSLSPIR
ncbi:NIPSNAP family protein [Roseibium aggregatum]|uniref:NIPSNAP family protein n=1 Tax=Roseibium aggregatum TaxID=187304 RepID=A0A926P6Q6_9HYPH|nr:NIPSNAP family protein [Roseibium aggregatum]MBD1549392.1 NIPSNAP family protein [Roseibium aggregatum]